ncbi:MAG: hypothetical protein KGO96_06520 [Elusimicrobia bacterium]|nr:hypothetical protein [Elusimicrobiota bacterium]MDE2425544.1 hypothetical protein [Elusimicrobiota bacterium]
MNKDCYCDLWDKEEGRQLLIKKGVPRGFCGLCERCGAPGHTRHFVGLPRTGCLCFRHARRQALSVLLNPLRPEGMIAWFLACACALAAFFIWRAWRG